MSYMTLTYKVIFCPLIGQKKAVYVKKARSRTEVGALEIESYIFSFIEQSHLTQKIPPPQHQRKTTYP